MIKSNILFKFFLFYKSSFILLKIMNNYILTNQIKTKKNIVGWCDKKKRVFKKKNLT